MARITIGKAAAFMASVGIALSGIALSTPAVAQLSCERRMFNKCSYNQYWYYAGYPTFIDCHEDQVIQNCLTAEYGLHGRPEPFTRS